MKKTVAVVIVSLCCWFLPEVAFSRCVPADREAEIDIVVEDGRFSYLDKEDDPVPCIYRQGKIKVSVTFKGSEHESIVMRDFYAQAFFNTRNGWTKDDEEDLKNPLKMTVDGTKNGTEVEFRNPKSSGPVEKTIMLQVNKGPGAAHGPNRLITFTLVFKNDKGEEVMIFDPPWGERP